MHSTNLDLAIGAGVTSLGMGLIAPVLPFYAQSLGASPSLLGLFLASFGVARLFVSLPTVWFAKRIGFRPLLIGSPTLIALASLFCALIANFWSLALFCAIEGASAAIFATASTAALITSSTKKRGRSLSLYQAAGLFGASIGPGLGGIVAQKFGLPAPFLLYALLAAFIAWWLYWRLGNQTFSSLPVKETGKPGQPRLNSSWKYWAAPKLLPFWLIGFSLVFSRLGLQLLIVPLFGAQRLGLNPFEIGVTLSLGGIAGLLILFPAGWLVDNYGSKAGVISGILVIITALVLLAITGTYILFALAVILNSMGNSLANPGAVAYLAETAPEDGSTLGVGLYRTVGDAGSILAPIILGWLVDQRGYSVSLIASILLLLGTVSSFTWFAPSVSHKLKVAQLGEKSELPHC